MKKQIIGMMCLAAMMSSCHIYKAYDRPETIDASGVYRDPASATDTLAADTANMGNLPWKEIFRDAKLQALIEEGLANNVDMQAAALRVQEAKVMLTAAKLSYLPSINLAPQGTTTSMGGGNYVKAYQLPVVRKDSEHQTWSESCLRTESVCRTGCTFTDYLWYS